MKDVYCLLTVCLLCKRIVVEPQPIQTARKPFRDLQSCLQRCRRYLVLTTNCEEFCRLRPLQESQSKLRSRIRRSIGRKVCPPLLKKGDPERVVPRDQIKCEFVQDHADNWTAVVKWKSTNDLSKVDGYRFSYEATPTNRSGKALCIIVGKNETQFIINDGENWTYPMGLAIVVSLYHANSSFASGLVYDVAQFWPTGVGTKERAPLAKVPGTKADYWVIILGIIGGLVFTSILIFEYRRRTRRWIISSPPDFRYDAFIIYSSHESPFVERVLLPLLEGKFHLSCCIHHRDFMPGESIHQNMADSVTNSRKIITVVSKHFLESKYCNYELELALQRLLDWRDNCVVVIKVDNVDRKLLPLQLRARSYIDYNDKVERCSWKSRLYKFLSVNTTSTSPLSETVDANHSDELINNNDQATSSVM